MSAWTDKPYRSSRSKRTRQKKENFGKGCGSKRGYATEAEALEVVDRIRRCGKARETEFRYLRPYLCGHCQRWHNGHGPRESAFPIVPEVTGLVESVDQATKE